MSKESLFPHHIEFWVEEIKLLQKIAHRQLVTGAYADLPDVGK